MESPPTSPLPSDPSALPKHGMLECALFYFLFAIPGAILRSRATRQQQAATAAGTTVTNWAYEYGWWSVLPWLTMHVTHFGTLHRKGGGHTQGFTVQLVIYISVLLYAKMVIELISPLWDRIHAERKAKEEAAQQLKNHSITHYGSTFASSSSPLSPLIVVDEVPMTSIASKVEGDINQRPKFNRTANLCLVFLAITTIAFSGFSYFDGGIDKSLKEWIRERATVYFIQVMVLLLAFTLRAAVNLRPAATLSFKTKCLHWFVYGKLILSICFQLLLLGVAAKYPRDDSDSTQWWNYWSAISVPAFLSIMLLTGDLEKEFSVNVDVDVDSSAV